MDIIRKTPYEQFPIRFNMRNEIYGDGEFLASHTLVCINTLNQVDSKADIVQSDFLDSPSIAAIIQDGILGEVHKFSASATTNNGDVFEKDAFLFIEDDPLYRIFFKEPIDTFLIRCDFPLALEEGDFIILENAFFKPSDEKGSLKVHLNETPLFQIKLKDGKLKILDFIYAFEETPVHAK